MLEMKKLPIFVVLLAFLSCNPTEENDTQAENSTPAIGVLQVQMNKYPDSLLLGQQLIEAYRDNGNYDSALALTARLMDVDTGNAYLWNIMATLHYETGDAAGTIRALEKAVEVYPLPDYYIALGTVYAEQKDPKALMISDALLDEPEAGNTRDDAYFIKGLYYNYSEEYEKAIPVLDSALALNYTYMFAYREKAIALYELHQYAKSIDVLRRAVMLKNSYDEGYYWMGKAYEKMHKKDSAVMCYQNALLYDKDYKQARESLDRLTKNKN